MKYTKEQIQLVILFGMARNQARQLAEAGKLASTLTNSAIKNILPAESEEEILNSMVKEFGQALKKAVDAGQFSIETELKNIENIVKTPNL